MTISPAKDDLSTYKRPLVDPWSGADVTNKEARQKNMQAYMRYAVPNAIRTQASNTTTNADWSINRRGFSNPNHIVSVPQSSPPAPFPFLESHFDMLLYKDLNDGWDDVSSKGVSADAVDTALEFLARLPSHVMAPEASASGDGTVDWYWRNGQYAATVTFYPGDRVAYYAMTEASEAKGSFRFYGSIPGDLAESLRQF
ncbi:MAG: hypothetical protein OXC66_12515 [Roseovarius sp.]|nr:hypothetical protein [Roseovarius sp.]